MRYKASDKPSDVVLELELRDGWAVDVRYISRARDQILQQAHSRKQRDPQTGALVDQLDWPRYLDAYFAECIVDWRGLTPRILESLVEFAAGSEQPQPNGDGAIPFDAELAEFLRRNAHADKFENPIWRFSRDLLEAERLQREAREKNSGG